MVTNHYTIPKRVRQDDAELPSRYFRKSTTEAVLTDVVDMLTDMLSMGYNESGRFRTFSLSLAFEDEKPREILNQMIR